MSSKVLSVVYHVLPVREITSRTPETEVASAFREAVRAGEWLYDPSDDPSFYSARRFAAEGGALSWGICRRNVRCPLKRGDLVSFVGMEDRDGLCVYYFCGWATVARKVTQAAIWTDDELSVYRRYLNLLCKPASEGFAHYEPHASDLHDDWLWRMTCTPNKRWKLEDFARYSDPEGVMTFNPDVDRAANGVPITLGANYVIFDPAGTFILDEPPALAERPRGQVGETWYDDAFATAVYELTFGRQRPRRRARSAFHISNGENPHPPLALGDHPASWRRDASTTMKRFGRDPFIPQAARAA